MLAFALISDYALILFRYKKKSLILNNKNKQRKKKIQ